MLTISLPSGEVQRRINGEQGSRNQQGNYVFVQDCGSLDSKVLFANQEAIVQNAITDCTDGPFTGPEFYYASLSPNSEYVSYVPDGLVVYPSTTIVKDIRGNTIASFEDYLDPAWTTDNRLLVTGGGNSAPYGLYLSDSSLQNLERIDNGQINGFAGFLTVSSQGTVAFIYNQEIWQINLDGSNFGVLYRDPAPLLYPVWSPDGKTIAFLAKNNYNALYSSVFFYEIASQVLYALPIQVGGEIFVQGPLSWLSY